MVSIRFNLTRTTGKITTIRVIMRKNQKWTMSTGIKVEVAEWDKRREKCKNDSRTNQMLDELRKKIKEFWETNERAPTREDLEKPTSNQSITSLINHHGQKVIGTTGKPNTEKAYKSLVTNIERFTTETNQPIPDIDKLKEEFLLQFRSWMKRKMFSDGHAGKMMQTLRTTIKGKISDKEWDQVKPVQMKPTTAIYLTTDEIKLIETVKLNQRLDKARDLFLIGYYTGQRYSDWAKIKQTNTISVEKSQIVQFNAQKTGTNTAIPLRPKLIEILGKYQNQPPMISNQKLNKYIREVAKLAGINQKTTVKEYRGQQEIERTCEKWELVTSHTARRSFATNALLAGIPINQIMKLGGWKSINAFQNYIRTTEVETALQLAEHQFFK